MLKLNGPFSDQLIHVWDTTIPYCLSVMHMSLWLCVFVIIRRDHRVKIGQKSLPFALDFVFHPHPAIAHCLRFVSMAWTSRLLGSFKILQKHRYIFYYYYCCQARFPRQWLKKQHGQYLFHTCLRLILRFQFLEFGPGSPEKWLLSLYNWPNDQFYYRWQYVWFS